MLKRLFSTVMFILLLTGLLTLAFNIQPVKASGTIYIRADGSIDPSTAPITTVDNVTYILTGNITSDADGIVVERSNIIIDGNGYTLQGMGTGYGFYLFFRNNVTIKNTRIMEFYNGIYLDQSLGNTIMGNTVRDSPYSSDIRLIGSPNNIIKDNVITNSEGGVSLTYWSSGNTVIGNTMTANSGGINVYISSNNIIVGNNLEDNYGGINVGGDSFGNTIAGNYISNNEIGIGMGYQSYGNLVTANYIANNKHGTQIDWASDNDLYHNNFINNTYQAYLYFAGKNTWDDGYPSGGNYWSDYNGTDFYSGPYQNETGSDGQGDTPYSIDADNRDGYPLMHPWSSLPVHNMNTGLGYVAIQEAINANETLDGHTIFVEAGIYQSSGTLSVNKTIDLIGEGRLVTIIDSYEVDVTANNVTVSGFAILGCVSLEADGCTVDDNTIFDAYWYGIGLLNCTNNVISNNVLLNNNPYSIYLSDSSNNTIIQNYIDSIVLEGSKLLLDYGIWMRESSNNSIVQNNLISCRRAIDIEQYGGFENIDKSSNNRIVENNIEHLDWGVRLSWSSNNTILENNITASRLWRGMIPESTGISLGQSFNNSIVKNNIGYNGEGVKLVDSSFNSIIDNNLTDNFYGILLQGSQVNSLIGNNVTCGFVTFEGSNEISRIGFGILISSYYSNLLRNNTIAGYKYNFGVSGYFSEYAYFQDVDTSNTVDGKPIYFWGDRQSGQIPSDAGYVAIVNCTNIIVEGLELKNNYQGILIAYCNDTIIRQNNVANNYYGISLAASSNNAIYHNNFINNSNQVGIWVESLLNVWDDGYPSGGNRWSDYAGTDSYSGLYQNVTGSDGIGDSPYVIDENNQDRYPLGIFSAHLLGDLNQDGIVNILDAVQAASAFGSHAGDPGWNEQADINRDGVVNILDLVILANNFGKH